MTRESIRQKAQEIKSFLEENEMSLTEVINFCTEEAERTELVGLIWGKLPNTYRWDDEGTLDGLAEVYDYHEGAIMAVLEELAQSS